MFGEHNQNPNGEMLNYLETQMVGSRRRNLEEHRAQLMVHAQYPRSLPWKCTVGGQGTASLLSRNPSLPFQSGKEKAALGGVRAEAKRACLSLKQCPLVQLVPKMIDGNHFMCRWGLVPKPDVCTLKKVPRDPAYTCLSVTQPVWGNWLRRVRENPHFL